MNKRGLVFFQVLGILLILGAVALMVVSGRTGPTAPGGEQEQKLECDLVIVRDLIGSRRIDTVNCNYVGACSIFDRISLNILGGKGIVKMYDDASSLLDQKPYGVNVANSAEVTLTGCTDTSSVTFKLLNEEGNIVESKTTEVFK